MELCPFKVTILPTCAEYSPPQFAVGAMFPASTETITKSSAEETPLSSMRKERTYSPTTSGTKEGLLAVGLWLSVKTESLTDDSLGTLANSQTNETSSALEEHQVLCAPFKVTACPRLWVISVPASATVLLST